MTLNESRVDDIASRALSFNGPSSGLFEALATVEQAFDSILFRAALGANDPEGMEALKIVKARFLSLVGEDEWISWWEGAFSEKEGLEESL